MSSSRRPARGSAADTPRPLSLLQDYLEQVAGGRGDQALLQRAMTHRSYSFENDHAPHNERLEFLGDSVLGLVVTDHLYRVHPDLAEGQLAKLRAAVVNTRALAEAARTIGLGGFLRLGRGEESTGGRDKDSILADTTEAVIGCLHLSHGQGAAAIFVHHLLDPLMRRTAHLDVSLDWKTSLQELTTGAGLPSPAYTSTHEGPDHDKVFTAQAQVGDEVLGTGTGRSKKVAEQQAAERAWARLSERAGHAPLPARPIDRL